MYEFGVIVDSLVCLPLWVLDVYSDVICPLGFCLSIVCCSYVLFGVVYLVRFVVGI